MLLRPSGLLNLLAITACALFIALVCTMLYGTRSENPGLPSLVKEVLPAGRCLCESSTIFACDTCLDCAAASAGEGYVRGGNVSTGVGTAAGKVVEAGEKEAEAWVFTYPRDANDYGLDEEQCQAAFPGLYEDIERANRYRRGLGKVSRAELSSFDLSKGMVRAMVYNGELYILETFLVDNVNREKAIAALSSLHRALVSSPSRSRSPLPNIEFVFSVEDLPAQPTKPVWGLARRAHDHAIWLIPDFGFWSWDMPSIGAFSEVAAEAIQREEVEPWDAKTEKLVWRGKLSYAPKLRHALLDAAKGRSWSDVGQVKWGEPEFKEQFLGPVDQCSYMFIAHAEGRSYSGALKYRQLCRSVILSHELQWIQHHHYLLVHSGPRQNYVLVSRDFSDLDAKMRDLLAHPEKAKRIADNSVAVFRERYLTPAAEACYWRVLVRRWKEVLGWEPELFEEGKKGRRKRGVRFETFVIYDHQKQMSYPSSAGTTHPETRG